MTTVRVITSTGTADWELDAWIDEYAGGRRDLLEFIEDSLTESGVAYLGETEFRLSPAVD